MKEIIEDTRHIYVNKPLLYEVIRRKRIDVKETVIKIYLVKIKEKNA
jgi:hypothetical protein